MKLRQNKLGFQILSVVPAYIWLFLFAALIYLLTIINLSPRMEAFIPEQPKKQVEDYQKGFLIKTEGCKIPELPETNEYLEKYFQYEYEGAHCNHDIPPLVDSNSTSLFILRESFGSYNITDRNLLYCCYEELLRKEPKEGQSDKQYVFGETCYDFEDSINVAEEFVHVKCNYSQKQIYEDFFAFVPMKTNVTKDRKREKINVLVIGIDGISRINFHRQMKKSVETLKHLGFQELLGYNKVADNTYPNLIAVLTGNDEKTILNTCRKSSRYYDDCNFIWNNFKDRGYATSFSEDSAWMGTFNYQKYGFKKQPTDYMYSFFDRISEDLIGNSKDWNVMQCIGAREGYKMIVKYIYDFVHKMKSWKLPYFAFSWSSSLSHDYVNKPRIGDQFYTDFFNEMYIKGFFENTVVIVMSDHGIRFGSFRQTYQGRIEERLPFLFIRLPLEFKERYPTATSNLRNNLRRLTTPFDLHETLQDLSSPENLLEVEVRKPKTKYGISLFSKIPPTRTCEDAGITDHWCTCLDSEPMDITPEVKNITNFMIDYLNNLLKGYAQCAKLHLKTIRNAQVLSHPEKSFGSKDHVKNFLISFETEPGNGSFEATVRKSKSGKMDLVGTVSRLNMYGKQSACITDFHLKLYCYCKAVWS